MLFLGSEQGPNKTKIKFQARSTNSEKQSLKLNQACARVRLNMEVRLDSKFQSLPLTIGEKAASISVPSAIRPHNCAGTVNATVGC